MRRSWRNLLIGGFVLAFLLLLGSFNATKPRILVLHSGSSDSPWVKQVDKGMRSALDLNRRPVSMEWNYLDTASMTAARPAEQTAAEARRAIARFKPDVLIAVDDEANAFVARDYVGRERPRILYVSIDQPPAFYGYSGAPNVSGVAEQLPWKALRDSLSQIFPGRPLSVAAVGVDGATGRAELAQLTAFDWGPVTLGRTALVSTAESWRDFVAQSDADVLVVLHTEDLPDARGGVVGAADLNTWTQDNARPLPIGTQVGFVADGGGLSFSPPPDFYGESAIRLALDWLDDRTSPGPPAPVESSHFEVAVRQGALARRGITLPQIYLEAARENGTLFP